MQSIQCCNEWQRNIRVGHNTVVSGVAYFFVAWFRTYLTGNKLTYDNAMDKLVNLCLVEAYPATGSQRSCLCP
jgi:hypothetical protein